MNPALKIILEAALDDHAGALKFQDSLDEIYTKFCVIPFQKAWREKLRLANNKKCFDCNIVIYKSWYGDLCFDCRQ